MANDGKISKHFVVVSVNTHNVLSNDSLGHRISVMVAKVQWRQKLILHVCIKTFGKIVIDLYMS